MRTGSQYSKGKLSPEELERRMPVWEALSDHFLDTGTRGWMPQHAEVLLRSGYSAEELDDIWRLEVASTFGINLYSPAGVWEGFRIEGRVLKKLKARTSRRWRLLRLLRYRVFFGINESEWRAQRSLFLLKGASTDSRTAT